jgi:hypothetical protein
MKKISATLFGIAALCLITRANPQDTACFPTAPQGHPPQCTCVLYLDSIGSCWCEEVGSMCATGGICPEGPNGTGCEYSLTKEQVRQVFAAHKNIVTLYIKQAAYDNGAKIWMDEAIRQGKALRIVTIPDLQGPSEVEEYNERLRMLRGTFKAQEEAMDKIGTSEPLNQ